MTRHASRTIMAYKDLREFILKLEKNKELVRIKTEVSPVLEITEIADRISKSHGPALLFEHLKGYSFPILINAFGSYKRMAMALEVNHTDEIAKRIKEMMKPHIPDGFFGKLQMLPKLKEISDSVPKIVSHGPCQEVVLKDGPMLDSIPVLTCWPHDGGPFITLPMVFTKDSETGQRNCGMYRMQVYDRVTCGMHWHIHKDGRRHYLKHEKSGKPMEVAVAIGGDPAVIYAATAPLPPDIDEMMFAGFLRKKPVELVKCKTVDIEVPAHSEFILEGEIMPGEFHVEGPFGDHTGFYSPADNYPVMHIKCITHRKDAIYPATIVGKPPMEDCYMAKATERIFLPMLQMILPEIVDINLPIEGVFHNCAIISIKKTYPAQGKKVINALWGMGQMMNTKFIITVEDDTDVQNINEVAWRAFNNVDPKRDFVFSEGPLDVLDHSASWPLFGNKLGIDATRKGPQEGMQRPWPEEIKMSKEIKDLVDRKWKEYFVTND